MTKKSAEDLMKQGYVFTHPILQDRSIKLFWNSRSFHLDCIHANLSIVKDLLRNADNDWIMLKRSGHLDYLYNKHI